MTDEAKRYAQLGDEFAKHDAVDHSRASAYRRPESRKPPPPARIFLVELRGFEPLTSVVEAPAVTAPSLPRLNIAKGARS
jgi:hypothetical protein